MKRYTSFALGATFLLITTLWAIAGMWAVGKSSRSDVPIMLAIAVVGTGVLFFLAMMLIGRTIWPPEDKAKKQQGQSNQSKA